MPSPTRWTAAAVLACLCLIALGCSRSQPAAHDPESAAAAFFTAVESGSTRAAYDSSAFGFQASQSFDGFVSNSQQIGLIGGKPPVWTTKKIAPTEARLDGTFVNQHGDSVHVVVKLTTDGTIWKLFSLSTPDPTQQSPRLFTTMGKGAGFNDVYHQPMPTADQAGELVRHTLTLFNHAITTDDFHDFYKSISQKWKDLQPGEGGAIGATEKIVHDHFQGFVQQKVDLTPALSGPIVLDQPPYIADSGDLVLNGYIESPQYRVVFNLEYVYELPRWRLFGINVELRKP
jgi:hypothetical protein